MKIYCFSDSKAKAILNKQQKDYTGAYIPIMLKNLGFSASTLFSDKLCTVGRGDVIFIGAQRLEDDICDKLFLAKQRGAHIIAFATEGKIFPKTEKKASASDCYGVVGYFEFADDTTSLPILGYALKIKEGKALGFFEGDTALAEYDGMLYWGFDLPATVLYASDGRPTVDANNVVGHPRIPDSTVITKKEDYQSAFSDRYLKRLADFLNAFGFAYVYPLPEVNNKPADMALFFAGDDDATSTQYDIKAAYQMQKRALPYHINMMPMDKNGNFRLTREQADTLAKNGCELALHYDFTAFPYSKEGYLTQSDMFYKAFGKNSICPVNHCFIQSGSAADRYRFEAECGCLGDNNRAHYCPDPDNVNAFSLVGFGSGTAFPRFVMDDAKHCNAPLDFCELGVSFYEPRLYQNDLENRLKIEKYLDEGLKYNRPLQMFFHPHYISGVKHDNTASLAALDYALSYLKNKNCNVWFCTPDALTVWWHQRAEVEIYDVTEDGFSVSNPTPHTVYVIPPDGFFEKKLLKVKKGVHRFTKQP